VVLEDPVVVKVFLIVGLIPGSGGRALDPCTNKSDGRKKGRDPWEPPTKKKMQQGQQKKHQGKGKKSKGGGELKF